MKLEQTLIDKFIEKVYKNYDKYEWIDHSYTSCISSGSLTNLDYDKICFNVYSTKFNIKNNLIDYLEIKITDEWLQRYNIPNIMIYINDDSSNIQDPLLIGYYIIENDKNKNLKNILVKSLLTNITNLVKFQKDKKQEEELKQKQLKDQQLKQDIHNFINTFLEEKNNG